MPDLRVVLPNRPGSVLEALTALADKGINIESFCGDLRPGESWGYVHILVTDAERARAVLGELGFEVVSEHDVDVISVENHPGGLADAVRRYSDEMRNIEVLYTARDGRVVIGTEDMQKPRPGVRVKDARY
jgi:hypothetical protein